MTTRSGMKKASASMSPTPAPCSRTEVTRGWGRPYLYARSRIDKGLQPTGTKPGVWRPADGPMMIRVLVVDDHPVVRTGLRTILTRRAHMVALGEAATGAEVRRLVAQQHWDVVVLDENLPDCSSLDLVREIKRERPKLPILLLSVHPEGNHAVRALRAGASGYISKQAAPEELVSAVRQLAQGRRYMSPTAAEELVAALGSGRASDQAPHERLSDREYQVLCLLGSGKTVGKIAQELKRSVKTISTYRTRILEKMELQSTAQLVHYVLQQHLAEPA